MKILRKFVEKNLFHLLENNNITFNWALTFCLCLTRLALTSSSQAAGNALSGNLCTQTRWKSPKTLITLHQTDKKRTPRGR